MEIARTQRRGRPGITPEFPVCRSEAAAAARPPESVAECTDHGDSVNQISCRRPIGMVYQPRAVSWQTLTIARQSDVKR